jgi:hypothetical protein
MGFFSGSVLTHFIFNILYVLRKKETEVMQYELC